MKDDNLGKMETCSWCVTEVEWTDLTETDEGNLCLACFSELHSTTFPNY